MRIASLVTAVSILLLGCGSSSSTRGTDSSIGFVPDSAPLSGASCTSQATLLSRVPSVVTLQTLTARVRAADGKETSLEGTVESFGVPAGDVVVPAAGVVTFDLTLDPSGAGTSVPFQIDVTVTGVFEGGSTVFTGSFQCG